MYAAASYADALYADALYADALYADALYADAWCEDASYDDATYEEATYVDTRICQNIFAKMYLAKCIWQNDDHYHDCIVHTLTIYDAVRFGNKRTDRRTNERTDKAIPGVGCWVFLTLNHSVFVSLYLCI